MKTEGCSNAHFLHNNGRPLPLPRTTPNFHNSADKRCTIHHIRWKFCRTRPEALISRKEMFSKQANIKMAVPDLFARSFLCSRKRTPETSSLDKQWLQLMVWTILLSMVIIWGWWEENNVDKISDEIFAPTLHLHCGSDIEPTFLKKKALQSNLHVTFVLDM